MHLQGSRCLSVVATLLAACELRSMAPDSVWSFPRGCIFFGILKLKIKALLLSSHTRWCLCRKCWCKQGSCGVADRLIVDWRLRGNDMSYAHGQQLLLWRWTWTYLVLPKATWKENFAHNNLCLWQGELPTSCACPVSTVWLPYKDWRLKVSCRTPTYIQKLPSHSFRGQVVK